ncbi:MAG: hypothetical protein LLG04_16385 [Parachlamydia sp.]|nr:hypothetical protein [Parachlamydia sp.]
MLASVPSYAAALTSTTVLALTSKSILENIPVFAFLFIGSMLLVLCGLFCLDRILKRESQTSFKCSNGA